MKRLFAITLWALSLCTLTFAQSKPMLRLSTEKQVQVTENLIEKADFYWEGNHYVSKPRVRDVIQNTTYRIKVQNLSGAVRGLTVDYVILGRDPKTKEVRLGVKGERTLDLKPGQPQTFDTETTQFTVREKKFIKGGVPKSYDDESGTALYGIAVVAKLANDCIAVLYEPPAIEQQMRKLNIQF